jgi:predicted transglutaminase-like cysteine proteinase
MQEMADAARERMKRIGAIGLIVCVCLVCLQQGPALVQLEASARSGFQTLTSLVDAQFAAHPTTVDFRAERSLFGMETEPVFGKLAAKWRSLNLEIDREEKVLRNCRAQKPCPEPARELLNIAAEAGDHTGRARIGLINRAVDLAITPTSDEVQWGIEDRWSSPFETLRSRRGDCEDYAIVKYVALREAGLSVADVKIVIVRNFFPKEYHAVAAVRLNEEWLILDNRWLTLVRDTDMTRATPEFLLDDNGVHHFIPSNEAMPSARPLISASQFFGHA